MPIKKGTTNTSIIKRGDTFITKAYVGDKLVFNYDTVWMLRTNAGWYYSIDGIRYHLLASESGNFSNSFAYSNGKFIWNDWRMDSSGTRRSLRLYDVEQLRRGILSVIYRGDNKWAYSQNNIMASDGEGTLVTNEIINIEGGDAKAVNYSFDDGVTWSLRKLPNDNQYLGKYMRYIGNGRFFLHVPLSSDEGIGCYSYWDKNSPTSWYRCAYALPDNSSPFGKNWCQSIWACNDGKKYVTVNYKSKSDYSGFQTQLDQYRGSFTKGSNKVICSDIGATGYGLSGKNIKYLDYITYIYGKYYAILVSGYTTRDAAGSTTEPCEYRTTGASRNLYTSTDGITFTRVENFFPSTVYQISKTAGVLSVYGETFAGIIKRNETLHYTTLSGNSETGGIVCNKQ